MDSEWSRHPLRSNLFDAAILGSERRAWHPLTLGPELLEPGDDEAATIGEEIVPGLRAPSVLSRLTTAETRGRFADATARLYFSDILHGERAALKHAARQCLEAAELGAQENAANQAREEARHVSAFSFYIQRRWGEPAPPTPVFAALLHDVEHGDALTRIVGMQVIVEGLAMGVFRALHDATVDPLAREILRLVMADEAAHLRAGTTSLQQAIAEASERTVRCARSWAAQQFGALARGLFAPTQQAALYAAFDLDPREAEADLKRRAAGDAQAHVFSGVFHTLAVAAVRAELVDDRTRRIYAPFLM